MNEPVAIITGAASGIGRASALCFARANYCLSLVDVNEEALSNVAVEIRSQGIEYEPLTLAGDLADLDFVLNIASQTQRHFGRLDLLINCAAWRRIETMRKIEPDSWDRTMAVCLRAPAFLSREAARIMEVQQTPGVIINLTSVMSDRAGGFSPAYVAAKGGLESLTRELAALYGPSGIRVISVSPGNVNTSLNDNLRGEAKQDISRELVDHVESLTPLGRSAEADEIAEGLRWLASPAASFISGTSIRIDGGFSANFNAYPLKKKQFPDEF